MAQTGAAIVAFPRADLRAQLGGAMKRHRLPDTLAADLVREAAKFPEITAGSALAFALDQRMQNAPVELETARGILLVGPSGGGKSAVAAKIAHAARLIGRDTELAKASDGLALFRTGTHPAGQLTIMEADGFNPLNPRAVSAFSALGDIEGVETIGVVSALNDAEDVADLVASFRFHRVIVTQMDRTRRWGALLAAVTGGARLAHVTRSARAEDGLERLSPHMLAEMLLDSFSPR